MKAALIWATPDADKLVAYMARVSNPAAQDKDDAGKLISYLIRHKHWSPFEMVSLCIEIETTRDVSRQIIRHRSFSFSEFSQRYAATDALPPAPLREARMQDPKNRQASMLCEDDWKAEKWMRSQEHVLKVVREAYDDALRAGIAKEVARAVLPEGLTTSRMYMAGTLRSWLTFCALRMGPETQLETRKVAAACWALVREACPVTAAAWEAQP